MLEWFKKKAFTQFHFGRQTKTIKMVQTHANNVRQQLDKQECSSGYSRKKRSIRPTVRQMKRICDKTADKRLERHRGMAIRNCQTARITYTHKHSLFWRNIHVRKLYTE